MQRRERTSLMFTRALRAVIAALVLGAASVACLVAEPSTAHAQVISEELRVKGWWPDLALAFGVGFGLGHALETPVFGRARVGVLYAYEPIIFNVGIAGEVGALAEQGFGAELELNHFGGPWLQVGFERVAGDDYMLHTTLGFTVLGIEWQTRFADRSQPSHALLAVLRAPLGIWSFLIVDDARRSKAQ
jgi:hypothetical protein